eukprot:gene2091-480_t
MLTSKTSTPVGQSTPLPGLTSPMTPCSLFATSSPTSPERLSPRSASAGDALPAPCLETSPSGASPGEPSPADPQVQTKAAHASKFHQGVSSSVLKFVYTSPPRPVPNVQKQAFQSPSRPSGATKSSRINPLSTESGFYSPPPSSPLSLAGSSNHPPESVSDVITPAPLRPDGSPAVPLSPLDGVPGVCRSPGHIMPSSPPLAASRPRRATIAQKPSACKTAAPAPSPAVEDDRTHSTCGTSSSSSMCGPAGKAVGAQNNAHVSRLQTTVRARSGSGSVNKFKALFEPGPEQAAKDYEMTLGQWNAKYRTLSFEDSFQRALKAPNCTVAWALLRANESNVFSPSAYVVQPRPPVNIIAQYSEDLLWDQLHLAAAKSKSVTLLGSMCPPRTDSTCSPDTALVWTAAASPGKTALLWHLMQIAHHRQSSIGPCPATMTQQSHPLSPLCAKVVVEFIRSVGSSSSCHALYAAVFCQPALPPQMDLVELVDLSLEYVGDLYKLVQGYSALHLACKSGNIDLAKALLKRGAPHGMEDGDGHTPLYLAATGGHWNLCILLQEKGASLLMLTSGSHPPVLSAPKIILQLMLQEHSSEELSFTAPPGSATVELMEDAAGALMVSHNIADCSGWGAAARVEGVLTACTGQKWELATALLREAPPGLDILCSASVEAVV